MTWHRRTRPLLRRLAYGRPRRPLEPHRPAPWLFRGLAWCLGASTLLLVGALPLLSLIAPTAARFAAGAALWALLGVLAAAAAAGATRPAQVVLRDPDSDGRA